MNKLKKTLLIISTSILLLVTPLLYYTFNIDFYAIHTIFNTTITKDQQIKSVENIHSFLLWTEGLNTNLTNEEISHMQDVKKIFNKVFITEIISIFIFLIVILFLFLERKIYTIMKWLSKWSKIILTLNVLILTSFVLDFKPVFETFHKIFFPQWNWAFDESSMLITLFPAEFFQSIATNIFLTSSGISLAMIIIYFLYKKFRRNMITIS